MNINIYIYNINALQTHKLQHKLLLIDACNKTFIPSLVLNQFINCIIMRSDGVLNGRDYTIIAKIYQGVYIVQIQIKDQDLVYFFIHKEMQVGPGGTR